MAGKYILRGKNQIVRHLTLRCHGALMALQSKAHDREL
jgi:hypothetical protein